MRAIASCRFYCKIMVAVSTFPICIPLLPIIIAIIIFHLGNTQAQLPPLSRSLSIDCSAYTSVFCFGDSLSDNGNLLYSNATASAGRLPYGQTFFRRPTGRYSDGRLIIDFLAEALDIPYLLPYLPYSRQKSFKHGANFAVGGATALAADFLADRGIPVQTPYSLSVQLSWFQQILPSICPPPYDCGARLRRTLFMVGEIGGNDYGFAFNQGWSIEQVKDQLVPNVIGATESAIKSLIEAGASSFLAPGMVGFGCLPLYLTVYPGRKKEDYNESTGCLTGLNKFSQFHNQELKKMLGRVQELYPHVSITFADLYNSAMRLFVSPREFGIKKTLITCCGEGGEYNFNNLRQCGDPGVEACNNPQFYLSWDGVHGTEMFYRLVTQGWLQGPYTTPPFNCQANVAQA